MILIISLYIILSLFGGTLWFLYKFKDREDQVNTQNSIVILIILELIPLVSLIAMILNSDFKNSAWLAPITSFWVLILWMLIITACIMYPILSKKNMIKKFLKDNGLRLFSYSLIVAINVFFTFLIIIGIAYSSIREFNINGFANFVGLAGIITTLLGILVTLLQFLSNEQK